MTLQIDIPTPAAREFVSCADDADELPPVFIGGWSAARNYVVHCPIATQAAQPVEVTDNEVNIFAQQAGLRNKFVALRARRRLNRTFRRNQRAFENVMDAVAHDPAGQRELQSIWTSRR